MAITRRAWLCAFSAVLAGARVARAQPRQAQVVVLFPGDAEDDEPAARAFFDEMRSLGWNDGGNVAYERLSGRGVREYVDRLAAAAAERAPDLIYAMTTSTALAAAKATDAVPVLFTTTADPVAAGLVVTLAQPGRNATGVYHLTGNSVTRRFELLKQVLPQANRIGAVLDRRSPEYERLKKTFQQAAAHVRIELALAEFTNYEAVAKIFAGFRRDGISTVALGSSFTLFSRRRDIALYAARNSLALVAHRVEWAEAGALLTYGADVADSQRRAARIADRILKGGAPARIPVEQATRLEWVVNRRTAGTLGIELAPALLKRADRVIG